MAPKIFGNNRVFCKGRLISGPDVRSCAASLLMIIVPSVIWQIEVGTWFAIEYSILFPFIGALLQAASLVFLLAAAFSDPGIIPRQKEFTEHYDARTKTYRTKPPPRYYDLLLRGHPFKLKFCTTCNIYRPPRCTHCSVCDNCIERFDHHCPWIGNCIGKRNYWLFYTFVTATSALNCFVLGTAAAHLALLTKALQDDRIMATGDALLQAMKDAPLSAVLVVYDVGIVWFTVGLCVYHNYLVCTNQTTYEQIKGVYSSGSNLFHRGVLGNCQDILGSRVRPKYFNGFTGRTCWPKGASEDVRELRQRGRGKGAGGAGAGEGPSIYEVGPRGGAHADDRTHGGAAL